MAISNLPKPRYLSRSDWPWPPRIGNACPKRAWWRPHGNLPLVFFISPVVHSTRPCKMGQNSRSIFSELTTWHTPVWPSCNSTDRTVRCLTTSSKSTTSRCWTSFTTKVGSSGYHPLALQCTRNSAKKRVFVGLVNINPAGGSPPRFNFSPLEPKPSPSFQHPTCPLEAMLIWPPTS